MRIIKSRNKFIKELRANDSMIYGKPYSKFDNEMDIYKDFVGESLEGFINFMEIMNLAIKQLEDNYVMSNVGFKVRIKDAIASIESTGILDDIFGMELITPHEIDKEILMLFMQNVFEPEACHRDKKLDKKNGYNAYHCVGIVRKDIAELSDEEICKHIFNAKTKRIKKKYKDINDAQKKDIPPEDLYEKCDMYPALKDYIKKNGGLEKNTFNTLRKLWKTVNLYYSQNDELRRKIPAIEVQYKTANIAEQSIYGNAKHNAYKHIDEADVIQKFRTKKLMRGMHFPFKFERKNGEMILQQTNQTLIEVWPFLKDEILSFRKEHPRILLSYDMHFATVFPELKPYVKKLGKTEPYISVRNHDKNQIWRLMKLRILDPEFALKEQTFQKSLEGEK